MRTHCKDCNKILDGKHFSYCKACSSKHSLARYYKLHPKTDKIKKIKSERDERVRKIKQKQEQFDAKFSQDVYNELIKDHDGRCEICGSVPKNKRLAVDHCHKTGIIRGLLCNNCNPMLGHSKDKEYILQAAILYLKKYQT